MDDEEHAVGLRCIAAVIFDEGANPLASLSVSGPMVRIGDERIPMLGEAVRRRADAITRQIGGTVPRTRAVVGAALKHRTETCAAVFGCVRYGTTSQSAVSGLRSGPAL